MEKVRNFLSKYLSHQSLREVAITLNHFCIIEIAVIVFFSWQGYDLLQWYKAMVTPETFDGVSFWAAMASLVGAIFGALKYINKTRNDNDN